MSLINAAYYRSVTSDGTRPIDHSLGRVQLINGDLFYSPNSRRIVNRPTCYDGVPVRQSNKNAFSEFLEPAWWMPDCPYLPFVPIRPVYAGVPFQYLFDVPLHFPRFRTGFLLDPKYILGWARVEKLLMDCIRVLLRHHALPSVSWIASTAIGCTGGFQHARDLRESVLNSRLWFSQWMAGLSYAIAMSKTFQNESVDEIFPYWFGFLSGQQFKQVWLSGLSSSQVSTFSPSVDRVGVFLQLLHPHREQPSVDWFSRYHVPVWYPWGRRETEASLTDQRLARLAPSTYMLQDAGTFLTRSPEPPSLQAPQASSSMQQASSSSRTFDCAASTVIIPSWKEFFEKRRLRNAHLMARETPQQRQSRESREKNPPTKRTKVFMWSPIEGGGYTRQSFYQSENGANLDSYGKHQKIYDAFSNEWDCCYEFGEISDDDFAGEDDGSDEEYPSMPPPLPVTDTVMENAEPLPNDEDRSFSVDAPINIQFDWEDLETSDLLYKFLGFVPPLPIPNRPSTIAQRDKSLFSTIVGLQRDDSQFFQSPVASFALEFLEHLNASRTPGNATWDIGTGNRMWFVESDMFKRMRVLERFDDKNRREKWFFFDFHDRARVPWMIAVRHVTDALYVCRLDRPGKTPLLDFEVARELLNRGIQFSTLLPLKSSPPTVGPSIAVPVRLFDYKFTIEDYHAYEQERAALLKEPRVARAALLRGGIVWRLAVATMSFDDVLQGPTIAATVFRRGNIFKTANESVDFCDDGLSQAELDVICGLHYCQNQRGPGYSSMSWWPTDSIWQQFAQHTRWTEKMDEWFLKRLENIRKGQVGPLNAERWRTQIRGSSASRRIDKFVTEAFDRFVDDHLTA